MREVVPVALPDAKLVLKKCDVRRYTFMRTRFFHTPEVEFVGYRLVKVCQVKCPPVIRQQWAKPSLEHKIEFMRKGTCLTEAFALIKLVVCSARSGVYRVFTHGCW